MSIDSLRDVAKKKISDARDLWHQRTVNIRYTPGGSDGKGNLTPPTTVESIALQVLESNAAVNAFTLAMQYIDESYRQLTEPKKEADPKKADAESQQAKGPY
jgi:hypothetical protein